MECEPTDKEEDVNVASPLVSVCVPSVFEPSLNVTVPVGVPPPAAGDTVAVKVTDCPQTEGLAEDVTEVVVVGCPIPVPVKEIDAGTTLKLLVMLRAPALEPIALGVNVTFTVQLALTARGEDDVQLSVSAKSPDVLTPSILSGPVPVFVTVICCAELVVPTFWPPNVRDTGLTLITGGGTVTGIVV